MHRPAPVNMQQQEGTHHALILELYGCRQLLRHQLCGLVPQQHSLRRCGRWEVHKHRVGLGIDHLQQAGQTDKVSALVVWQGDKYAVPVSVAHMQDTLRGLLRQLCVFCTERVAALQEPSLQLRLSYGADAAATTTGRAHPLKKTLNHTNKSLLHMLIDSSRFFSSDQENTPTHLGSCCLGSQLLVLHSFVDGCDSSTACRSPHC